MFYDARRALRYVHAGAIAWLEREFASAVEIMEDVTDAQAQEDQLQTFRDAAAQQRIDEIDERLAEERRRRDAQRSTDQYNARLA